MDRDQCQQQIEKSYEELATKWRKEHPHQNFPCQYPGGEDGGIIKIKFTGDVYSIILYSAPACSNGAEEEIVVQNKDCKMLASEVVWFE